MMRYHVLLLVFFAFAETEGFSIKSPLVRYFPRREMGGGPGQTAPRLRFVVRPPNGVILAVIPATITRSMQSNQDPTEVTIILQDTRASTSENFAMVHARFG